MKNVLRNIMEWKRNLSKISSYSDGSFKYFSLENPLSFGYFPDGRYIFHTPQNNVNSIKTFLIEQIRFRKINAFKYALNPLPNEENPAIIIYSQGRKEKNNIKNILNSLGIEKYEFKKGNNITIENINADAKFFPDIPAN